MLSKDSPEPRNLEPQKKGDWEKFTLSEIQDLIKHDKTAPSTMILVNAYLHFMRNPDTILIEDVIVRHQ